MNNVNWDSQMVKIGEELKGAGKKPKLLLHSCCAPCSTACIERLSPYFEITVFYYNPNLDSQEEYLLRSEEQKRYCLKLGLECVVEEFNPEEFYSSINGQENQPEGGARCFICYALRLNKTAKYAKEKGFEYFATTLTVSPLKNANKLNEIGIREGEINGVNYLPTDFKKQGGYLRSVALSKENEMYRQNYCGCVFSKTQK